MHSKEMAEDVKQSKIISRIIRFSELAPAMKLTYYTLEIIHISIQHLTVEDFREILNMLTKVNLKGYELGNYSAVYTVSKIKTLAYRTIYEFLSRIPKCL